MNIGNLKKEDYEEPCCPLKNPKAVTPIPLGRVMEKLDEYLDRNDYDAAERHLQYWMAEAEGLGDERGRLSLLNEQIGLYRKTDREALCLEACGQALGLARVLYPEPSVTLATTLINAATGCKAFGKAAEALPLYEEAKGIYETYLRDGDPRLGGLYNNMALTLAELEDFDSSEALFTKAMAVMAQAENGELEQAITCCNLADLALAAEGPEAAEDKISSLLERAWVLLNTPSLPRNGYYAFVCEKCAPAFDYHGFFGYAATLTARAKEYYEGT